jgi:hypothetical protein
MSQIEKMLEWIDHHSKRADCAEAINAELLLTLEALLYFAWDEGYSDTSPAVARAEAIVKTHKKVA